MAHTLKIAGASYAGVSVVHFYDTSGNTHDYMDEDDLAEKVIKGDIVLTPSTGSAKPIKIAGVSYEGVSLVHMYDTSGAKWNYVGVESMGDKAEQGDLTLSAPLVSNQEIEITTNAGVTILASKCY